MEELKTKKESAEDKSYATEQVIVFKQAGEEYGLLIDQIKEVVITPNITKMPQTPHYIKGVANIRGNIISIIDLEEKFDLRAAGEMSIAEAGQCYTLVVESEEYKVGILVNEVPNTLSVARSEIEEAVNVVSTGDIDQDYIKGIIKLEGRLVILIDIFKVLTEKDKDIVTNRGNIET